MKKVTILIYTLILMLYVDAAPLFADVIPGGYHPVHREIYITNISAFPDVVLIGYITGPMIQTYEVYRIEENVPLHKGYKFNDLKIFAIKKSVLDSKGGLDKIDFQELAKQTAPVDILDPDGGIVPNENPLEAEYYYYRITEMTATVVTLKLSRRVLTYNNGHRDRIIDY